ncbi:hypothetical protein [Bacillus alkalicola]|uniref:Uncharacterized protein n=1 Tax=Evansella alkalicola TaxID=745819 RepID=A0ABS6JXB5_9BACI|nr:hypothetical protein [Bacillus alkalicola]MBU9723216.1 hypothetical protein [Bacillus alkalicola]
MAHDQVRLLDRVNARTVPTFTMAPSLLRVSFLEQRLKLILAVRGDPDGI